MELQVESLEQVSRMKKAGSLLPPGCVLMYFGENFTRDFRDRFLGENLPEDMMVDLQGGKKLMVFKQIERYYQQKAPH